MSNPEFSFESKELFHAQKHHRVSSDVIRENEIYTALSLLGPSASHEAVAFPVKFDSLMRPAPHSSMATIPMRMVRLDQDLYRIASSGVGGTIEENGVWEVKQAIEVEAENDIQFIRSGYLLFSLPTDPLIANVDTDGKADPHSVDNW
jgi:hypothetical protein